MIMEMRNRNKAVYSAFIKHSQLLLLVVILPILLFSQIFMLVFPILDLCQSCVQTCVDGAYFTGM